MTFISKEKMVFYFKTVAICSTILILFFFVTTILNEKKQIVTNKNSSNYKMCFSEYITYCSFALVLGAYINVKRLVKLGVI